MITILAWISIIALCIFFLIGAWTCLGWLERWRIRRHNRTLVLCEPDPPDKLEPSNTAQDDGTCSVQDNVEYLIADALYRKDPDEN